MSSDRNCQQFCTNDTLEESSAYIDISKEQRRGVIVLEADYETIPESNSYYNFQYEQRSSSSGYQNMLSQKPSQPVHKQSGMSSANMQDRQPSTVAEPSQDDPTSEELKEKPPNYTALIVLSLLMCFFCWPASPCAILATINSVQVSTCTYM